MYNHFAIYLFFPFNSHNRTNEVGSLFKLRFPDAESRVNSLPEVAWLVGTEPEGSPRVPLRSCAPPHCQAVGLTRRLQETLLRQRSGYVGLWSPEFLPPDTLYPGAS